MAIINSSRSDMPRQESLPSSLIQLYKSRSTTSLPSRLTVRSPGSPSRSFHIPNSPLSVYNIPENDIENIESSSFQASRINENDDNKIHHHEKPTLIFRRRHTHRHSVGPIELKDSSCAFECCGKSLVDSLNQLSQGNIYTIVKCTKHNDDRSEKKTTQWGFFKKLSSTFKKLKGGKKEKVICGTGKYSETITVKRIKDGKKMVVKRVDKEKLTPMEYFTNAHETSCTCRSCRGLLQTESTQLIRRTRSTLTLSAHIKPRSNSVSSDPSPIQKKDINFAYRSASLPISTSPISENGIVQDVRELANSPRTSVINYNNPPNTSNPQTSILIGQRGESSNSLSISTLSSPSLQGVPLELKLLSVHSTDGLPKLVTYFSDERYYYYITKLHGVKQRKWKKPRSWHLKKYCDVYWDEYVLC
ncbi:27231_t:CDS:2 [Dentiscutata erythropus]|uniref:27231_t:CDS:1 n=1 Tax=Dentiscutata erythropus TaxID=1348616 RepID=A0A9N9J2I9_9GLOM|nr:27231_t:CDS:2 [Dentiscutata erythropus]